MAEENWWRIGWYRDAAGHSPVREWVRELPKEERAKIGWELRLLQEFGPLLGKPHVEHVEGPIWELRPFPWRLFYFAYTGRRFIVLHGYRKKGQRAPRQEIETALRRWADFVSRGGVDDETEG